MYKIGLALIGIIIGFLLRIVYESILRKSKRKRIIKGFYSELQANAEYLKHNYGQANSILAHLKGEQRPPILFIPLRIEQCEVFLMGGELDMDKELRDLVQHYLVTVDHLKVKIDEARYQEEKLNPKNLNKIVEGIQTYCSKNQPTCQRDHIYKHAEKIEKLLREKYSFLQ